MASGQARTAWGRLSRGWKVFLILGGVLLVFYIFCLPRDLFKGTSYSTIVLSRDGELLGARISDDGQWRFPERTTVPDKYALSLITFEDKYFRYHPGVNPFSIARALRDNLREGRTVSGGSTITMQVIRLSRQGERNLREKLLEAILATRLEWSLSKDRILALYASHAPFGGNVVGLDAAAWRYFGRDPEDLSWGEAATLAILPNSPSGMHPGKNRESLLAKRNRLLEELLSKGRIDSLTFTLAREEPLPDAPLPLPSYAFHMVQGLDRSNHGERITTSIDLPTQRSIEDLLSSWRGELEKTGIGDLSAVVLDTRTGEALAYCGNADPLSSRPGAQVDVLLSPRSTGSILKPFLFCALLGEGEILPGTLLPDVPMNINGFSPQNYDLLYTGAIEASQALQRSLNIPAVNMLRDYSVPRFHSLLKDAGMTSLGRASSDYGLSLILGGAEGRLAEITRMYMDMGRVALGEEPTVKGFPLLDRAAAWCTLDVLQEVNRPDEIDPRMLRSVARISWKTGTSYGGRDAWAVGVTPRYAIGVWAGNADGRGVAGLTGARTAGPVLFDILNLLPSHDGRFPQPPDEVFTKMEVCPMSGRPAGIYCPKKVPMKVPPKGARCEACPYHKVLDMDTLFVLPPSMARYYRLSHPEYGTTEILSRTNSLSAPMEFIYPQGGSVLYLPLQLDGTRKGAVFNLAHVNPDKRVYWNLDETYLEETRYIHEITLAPPPGKHILTVVDEDGNSLSLPFSVEESRGR